MRMHVYAGRRRHPMHLHPPSKRTNGKQVTIARPLELKIADSAFSWAYNLLATLFAGVIRGTLPLVCVCMCVRASSGFRHAVHVDGHARRRPTQPKIESVDETDHNAKTNNIHTSTHPHPKVYIANALRDVLGDHMSELLKALNDLARCVRGF